MNAILLDTDVVSYLFKRDSRAEKYNDILKNKQLFVSFMTVAELYQWAAIHHWGISRISQLESYLHERYSILPFD
ncbi:MAG: type II toxin-antitoxin system VapC family toxin, partial [Methylococcaceae bacterium]|nr:type II toxin-antitoxin system VapC family toxin [Methylococcaceae bacterium]